MRRQAASYGAPARQSTLHPASLLLAWCCLLVILQRADFWLLLPAAAVLATLAGLVAARLYGAMIRRTRWLFLSLIVLFLTMTPGVRLPPPWSFGLITEEGLLGAADHALRLVSLLALLALLLSRLDQRAIVAAIHLLSWPLKWLLDREQLSVRLLLTLDHVAADRRDWRDLLGAPPSTLAPATLILPAYPFGGKDACLVASALAAAIYAWVRM